jgi:hypothetical protein
MVSSPGVRDGYLRISLRRDGKRCNKLVNILVLEAFVGPCPPGMETCHDPDPTPANNRLENLRWDTHQNNVADTVRLGRTPRGERGGAAKLSWEKVNAIRQEYEPGRCGYRRLGRRHGVYWGTIRKIIKGQSWVVY